MTERLVFLSPAASSTTGPEPPAADREPPRVAGKSPSTWSIEEVMQFVRDADPSALAPHAELFRKHVSRINNFSKNVGLFAESKLTIN